MTNLAAIARDNAISLEVKKDGFVQRQDGSVILRLKCHPQEMPESIMKAAMGQRYMAVFVEIDDNEEPKKLHDAHTLPESGNKRLSAQADSAAESIVADQAQFTSPRKPVAPEKRLAQQAGICCADPMFQKYITELRGIETNEEQAASYVRAICGVQSRSEIIPLTPAGNAWGKLHGQFLVWLRDPDLAPVFDHQRERVTQ